MAAKLEAHRRKQLVCEITFSARSETIIKRGAETGTGAPSSMAARIVHRPSPESDTLPEKFESVGSLASALAVRSRSHDATTLPRRQTSATSARLKSY